MQEKNILRDPLFWLTFLLGGFFLSFTLWFGLAMDQSIFCYSAWVWKTYGLPPYVGAWDHSFPAIFLIHRLAMTLFGESVLGFRFFDFLVQLSCISMIYYLAKRLSGYGVSGFLAGVFYSIFYYSLDISGTAQREGYVFWVLLICIILAFSLQTRAWRRALVTGLLLGFVFLLKPFYGLAWPVFGLFFLAEKKDKLNKQAWIELAVFSLSCLALPALTVLLYWQAGHLDRLYQATIWFNFEVYSQMSDPALERKYFWFIYLPSLIFREYPQFFLSAAFIIGWQLIKPGLAKDKSLFWIISALMLVGIISYRMQAKYFAYHLIPFVAFLIILSGWAFGRIIYSLKDVTRSILGKVAIPVFCLVLVGTGIAQISPWLRSFGLNYCYRNFNRAYAAAFWERSDPQYASNYFLAAQDLRPLLNPGDQVATIGPYPLIPFLLKKKLPTYYLYMPHLLMMRRDRKIFPVQKELIRQYGAEIISARPRFIIMTREFSGQTKPLFNFMSFETGAALQNQFPELLKFIQTNYKPVNAIGAVYIYEITPSDKNGKAGK